MGTTPSSKIKAKVWVVEKGKIRSHSDYLATEEPLEIRLVANGVRRTVAVTMRTPGNDFELATGFLYSEGVIHKREDIRRITHCVDRQIDIENRYNIVNVELAADELPNLTSLERHFYTTSACGVCGKASLEGLRSRNFSTITTKQKVTPEILYSLPEKLRASQGIFAATGGLHAAGLFNIEGELLTVREDVGRHNALDKLIGTALLGDYLPLQNNIVTVSGRSSFEILQKCLAAGVPIVCAVSAPSSLAVALAEEFGITLIGFLRGERFNVYAGVERILI
ncbi:formate dehydrogenase accessory sulfurtransferase FdhD [Planktothrix sp. FACHB-1355]|uniref:Sulfur carrier protein FdhD n=1 Tax=Aerosakkonema funiforme FACHB-1375 TaxID=2949571 RepID=A0A926VIV7_9CYAN|nr:MULTISPECIES: formate dehydrogenase accessory sulfurtransferase FdhD [Oscillatoriales]MBD2184669.1 formate dehydrogenase accessory sulfurtransferase FdhD [Aerosakkonema funiforme FACHB-1375]MBD3558749.1 formate dehydrogenase accessory sulfurtransferase FdhD [Planktothrix sp. FACHB-1355]